MFSFCDIYWQMEYCTVRWKRKWSFLKYRIFLGNISILMKFLVDIWTDYKFFCTYFQVHKTEFSLLKNVKKHIHDAKNPSFQLLALCTFFIFWIRVKILDTNLSQFKTWFGIALRILELFENCVLFHFWHVLGNFLQFFACKRSTSFDFSYAYIWWKGIEIHENDSFQLLKIIFSILKSNYFLDISWIYERFCIYFFGMNFHHILPKMSPFGSEIDDSSLFSRVIIFFFFGSKSL